MRLAKDLRAIDPEAHFLGLFNVSGLASLFETIPPTTPWLKTHVQADTV